MKFQEALKNFLDHEVVVTTREDEYEGTMTEVGEDYIRIVDGTSNCLLNLAFVESVSEE